MPKPILILALIALGLIAALVLTGSKGTELELIGSYSIPTEEWTFGTMPVGGISGLVYDPAKGIYYGISDDRGDNGVPGRLYTLQITLDRGGIHDVRVCCVTFLDSDADSPGIQPYPPKGIDAEEVLLTPAGTLLISSERDADDHPWIREFALDGVLLREIPVPAEFQPSEGKGVRTNRAIEGMALTPDGRTLYVVNEQALVQDGPTSTVDHGTTVRIVQYDLSGEVPQIVAEYAYITEPVFAPPQGEYADNGVSAILYAKDLLPQYDLLIVERAYSEGVGNDIKIFGVRLEGADDIKEMSALPFPFSGKAVEKTLLLRISAIERFSDVPIRPDNIEAITLGPQLPNGHHTLILASDNNFNPHQRNLFIAFELVP